MWFVKIIFYQPFPHYKYSPILVPFSSHIYFVTSKQHLQNTKRWSLLLQHSCLWHLYSWALLSFKPPWLVQVRSQANNTCTVLLCICCFVWLWSFSFYCIVCITGFCDSKCAVRCSKAGRKDRCLKYCGICCEDCHCVPSGTYGNKDECPCYRDKKNSKGGPKCPWNSCSFVVI